MNVTRGCIFYWNNTVYPILIYSSHIQELNSPPTLHLFHWNCEIERLFQHWFLFFEGGVFLFSEETVLFNVLVSIQQYQFPLPRRVDYVKPRNVNHTRNFFCFPWSQLPLEIANSIAIHMVIWLISGCIHVPLKGKALVSRPTREDSVVLHAMPLYYWRRRRVTLASYSLTPPS